MFLAEVAAAPVLFLVADQLANNERKEKVFFAFAQSGKQLGLLCL